MRELRLRPFERSVGLVLVAFFVLLQLESLAISLVHRTEFVGAWEMASARRHLLPLAFALSLPFAVTSVIVARLALAHRVRLLGGLGLVASGALAYGISTGRHFAELSVRVPFVFVGALLGGAAVWMLARVLVRLRESSFAVVALLVAVAAWLADAFVLPRLYPAFHRGLCCVTLVAWAGTSVVFRTLRASGVLALVGILGLAVSLVWAPTAARAVHSEDNMRRVLVEHAPLLGRAVRVASLIAPPPELEADDAATMATLTTLRERAAKRPALDWQGRDIVLVTIDALRADHVSSYGYSRTTTPNIDALAARGVRFEHAYCPTPHTSYSVASLMTGKYMKPLLSLGATDDESETWPVLLRRYGYRTAAFYPPAVFFIDEHRFRRMRENGLGFEYRKEEFAGPELRRGQVERYLKAASKDKPLFLWLHLFEPHEPYEAHPEHPFSGEPRFDAYDSEVAAADAFVGDVVRLVGEHRAPGTVFVVSADHGEEHGDHGGRYHGTTVYEEQVRVPLVIAAPGTKPSVVSTPVQTIDLLPTTLAALDIPIPARLRGRDLGPTLAQAAETHSAASEGLAFAETDDYTLLARGNDRLICERKIGSCTLFDIERDPSERHAVTQRPERVLELRKLTAAIERETGKLEASRIPEGLRRALQGDRDAAEDVAPLLDDAQVEWRRSAARVAFKLRSSGIKAQLERAESHDDDVEVRRWCSLALARPATSSEPLLPARLAVLDEVLMKSTSAEERYAAALALAERGDGRGERELLERWRDAFAPGAPHAGELDDARELLAALASMGSKSSVPLLCRSLDDVRLRPHVIEALAQLGDARARPPLLRVFAEERYVHLRGPEARALVRLGERPKLEPLLARFAGTPEPLLEAIAIARDMGLLATTRGGWMAPRAEAPSTVSTTLRVGTEGPMRLLVLGSGQGTGPLTGTVDGVALKRDAAEPGTNVFSLELDAVHAGDVRVELSLASGIAAVWLVPRAAEIPPPPPVEWDAGPDTDPTTSNGLDGSQP